MTLSSVAMFPVALLCWALTLPFDRRKVILHRLTCFWASLYTWLNPAWPVKVVGREKIDPNETYVMVANHQSLLDIFVLFRLFTHFKWVSKIENFRIPFIGWNMYLNGYIQLKRGGRAVNYDRKEGALGILGQIESACFESAQLPGRRACAFGKHHDRISGGQVLSAGAQHHRDARAISALQLDVIVEAHVPANERDPEVLDLRNPLEMYEEAE